MGILVTGGAGSNWPPVLCVADAANAANASQPAAIAPVEGTLHECACDLAGRFAGDA